jgi:hypothetical protein
MTRRESRSSPTARESPPSVVQTYVLAPAQTRLGFATANCRLSVFGPTGYGDAESVGARHVFTVWARRRPARIRRATRGGPPAGPGPGGSREPGDSRRSSATPRGSPESRRPAGDSLPHGDSRAGPPPHRHPMVTPPGCDPSAAPGYGRDAHEGPGPS